jgi:hypothetical protein
MKTPGPAGNEDVYTSPSANKETSLSKKRKGMVKKTTMSFKDEHGNILHPIKKEDILINEEVHKLKSTDDQEKQGKALLQKLRSKFQ